MVSGPIIQNIALQAIAGLATGNWDVGNEFLRRTGDYAAFGSRLFGWIELLPTVGDYARAILEIHYSDDYGTTYYNRNTQDVVTTLSIYHIDVPFLGTTMRVSVTEVLNAAIQARAWFGVR